MFIFTYCLAVGYISEILGSSDKLKIMAMHD